MTATCPRSVVIGTGLIASAHLAALRRLGAREIVVWSPDEGRRTRFAERWAADPAPSLVDAIATPSATRVHVCSPPMQHLDSIELAAERGLAVLCEKPLAPTYPLARRAQDAIATARVSAWLGFNRRLDPGIVLMRRAVADGTIGRPVSVFGHYRQQWNAAPSTVDWRFDPALVGPSRTLTEIGSHWFDLASFVIDAPVVRVSARFGYLGTRPVAATAGAETVSPPNDDLFAALVELENGVVGAVHGTELAHGSVDEIELRVDGTEGSTMWDSAHPGLVRIGNKVSGIRVLGTDLPSDSVATVIEAVNESRAAELGVATFADGVANAAVLDAARRSAETRAWEEVAA